MTTTVEQKGGILWRWAKHQRERGRAWDVLAQCVFNWPSLPTAERAEVMEAYQRREDMAKNDERPAAPSRLAKHVVYCELGHRKYSEGFTKAEAARAFVGLVLGKEKFKWKNSTTVTAKDGVLVVTSAQLEDIMELDDGYKLPSPIPETVHQFLYGQWPRVKAEVVAPPPSSPRQRARAASGGNVTLAEICAAERWDPRTVRIALRREGWKMPEGGKWQWPTGSGIEKKLKKLFAG